MAYYGGCLARLTGQTSLYKTKNDGKNPDDFFMSNWMKEKDFGATGLCYPSKEFHQDLIKMEAMFLEFHAGYDKPYCPHEGVVETFRDNLIKEFPKYSQTLLQKLASSRTRVLVRALDRAIKDGHYESARSLRKTNEHKF